MDYEIDSKKMCYGAYGSHLYINFSGVGEVEICGEVRYFALQTGHSYDHCDYNYPTNDIEVYTDDNTVKAIDASYGDYKEFLCMVEDDSDIIKLSESGYFAALDTIRTQIEDAGMIVAEILSDEEEKIAGDDNFYVNVIFYDEDDRVCSPDEVKKFDDEDEATAYRDEQREAGNSAYFIEAEDAYNYNQCGF